jgi:hypothetical protein
MTISTDSDPKDVIESLHDALNGEEATEDDVAVLVVDHIIGASSSRSS